MCDVKEQKTCRVYAAFKVFMGGELKYLKYSAIYLHSVQKYERESQQNCLCLLGCFSPYLFDYACFSCVLLYYIKHSKSQLTIYHIVIRHLYTL